jgi:hypothetical protein
MKLSKKKYLILIFSYLFLLNFNANLAASQVLPTFDDKVSPSSCKGNAKPPLGDRQIVSIKLTNEAKIIPIEISPPRTIGFKFNAKSSDRLSIHIPVGVCSWLIEYDTRKSLDFNDSFSNTGDYILQISTFKGTINDEINLRLISSNATSSVDLKQNNPDLKASNLQMDWFINIVIPLIINIFSTLILILFGYFGINKSIKGYIDESKGREIEGLKQFWHHQGLKKQKFKFSNNPQYNIVYGKVNTQGMVGYIDQEFSTAIDKIKGFLKTHIRGNVKVHALNSGKRIDRTFFDENVIILVGSEHKITGLEKFFNDINLPHIFKEMDGENIVIRSVKKNGSSMNGIERRPSFIENAGIVDFAFGTITRIVQGQNGKLIIILNAEHGSGITGASLFLTSEYFHFLNEYCWDLEKINKKYTSYQLLVELNNDRMDSPVKTEIVSPRFRAWDDFNINDLDSAINCLCGIG